MSATDTQSVGRRFIDTINSGDWSDSPEFMSPDVVMYHPSSPEPVPGREAVQGFLGAFRQGFPDLHLTVVDSATEGEKIALSWTADGTHNGSLFGIPPTGKKMHIMGFSFLRVVDGMIVQDTVIEDTLGVFQQIGVAPPMGS